MPLTIGSTREELIAGIITRDRGYMPPANLSEKELLLSLAGPFGMDAMDTPRLFFNSPVMAAERARGLAVTANNLSSSPSLETGNLSRDTVKVDTNIGRAVIGAPADWTFLHNPGATGYFIGFSVCIPTTAALVPILASNNGNLSSAGLSIYAEPSTGKYVLWITKGDAANSTKHEPVVLALNVWQRLIFHVTATTSKLWMAGNANIDAPDSSTALSLAYATGASTQGLTVLNWSATHTSALPGLKTGAIVCAQGALTKENLINMTIAIK